MAHHQGHLEATHHNNIVAKDVPKSQLNHKITFSICLIPSNYALIATNINTPQFIIFDHLENNTTVLPLLLSFAVSPNTITSPPSPMTFTAQNQPISQKSQNSPKPELNNHC
eukprot:TRINITY_DN2502_c0_g2_i1.p1 TRINITY_DN2502_c0_g2~~TRINITY_DN2502_c0_g2_i1.p1  ORF type:complete len:112 (+),score=6.02 TRINITY_DN2502_c0_g2_i1:799-1134(+)